MFRSRRHEPRSLSSGVGKSRKSKSNYNFLDTYRVDAFYCYRFLSVIHSSIFDCSKERTPTILSMRIRLRTWFAVHNCFDLPFS